MTDHLRRRKAMRRACTAAVLAAMPSVALAGSQLTSSSVKWTFDPDSNGGSQLKTLNLAAPASGSMPAPPSYQLNQTFTLGNSSSVAKGSIGYVANATTATFTLAPGTGVTQSDPGNVNYTGNSVLKVEFDGLFTATSPSFGPTATGYVSIGVGGTVGAGGSTSFAGQVQFLTLAGAALRPTVTFSQQYSTAGAFAQTFTSSALMNPLSLAPGTQFRVKGVFQFTASNHYYSPSEITPFDFDIGAAPPTATWYGNSEGNSWNDSFNWSPPEGSVIEDLGDGSSEPSPSIPYVPNAPGHRARIVGITGNRTITLDNNVTVGALEINTEGNVTIESHYGKKLKLKTEGGDDASITASNQHGNRSLMINAPVELMDNADVMADADQTAGGSEGDSSAQIIFAKTISGAAGKGLTKVGKGKAIFNTTNTYSGGTTVEEGELDANAANALGTGFVKAKGGKLNYNAAHAAKLGMAVTAEDGGVINLGIVPQSNEKFVLGDLGAITGTTNQLKALSVGAGGNLQLGDGAMIAHTDWNTGSNGSPSGLGTTPKYTFGIAGDFVDPNEAYKIAVGKDSRTPWKGFGAAQGNFTFGSNPNKSNQQLQIKGAAELVSLGGILRINARISAASEYSSLDKRGAGAVEIQNVKNDFYGPVDVSEGALIINGAMQRTNLVAVCADATLGGDGSIDGLIRVDDGGILAPGGIRPGEKVGSLRGGELKLVPGSILNFDLGDPSEPSLNDLLDIKGKVTLDGTLNISDIGGFGIGSYTIITAKQIIDECLNLGAVPDGDFAYSIDVKPKKVVLTVTAALPLVPTAVPEPSGILLLLAGAGLLARRSRKA